MKIANGMWEKRQDVAVLKTPLQMEGTRRVVEAVARHDFPLKLDSAQAALYTRGPWGHGGAYEETERWYVATAQLEFKASGGRIIVKFAGKGDTLDQALDGMDPFTVYGVLSATVPREIYERAAEVPLWLARVFMDDNRDALSIKSGVEVPCSVGKRASVCGFSVQDFGEGHFGRIWEEFGYAHWSGVRAPNRMPPEPMVEPART